MPFRHAVILGGIPASIMAISTYIGLGKKVPDDISGALQHFAAGVLLCTVGTELLPVIVNAEGWAENVAALVGFFCGVAVLILLGIFSPDHDEEEKAIVEPPSGDNKDGESDKGKNHGKDDIDDVFRQSPTPGQKQQLREMKFVITGRKFRRPSNTNRPLRLTVKRSMSLSSLPLVSEEEPLISAPQNALEDYSANGNHIDSKDEEETGAVTTGRRFPLAFVSAVAIDSSLDGLLIGIASVAGPSAGPMMSASLSVEMGFLGLTLATTLSGQSRTKASLAALVGPVCLVLAAGLGGTLADTLSHNPVAFVGMQSFGASALLFMVAEELLLDAHEDGEHVWWVDLQLYTGFFSSIIAGKFVR